MYQNKIHILGNSYSGYETLHYAYPVSGGWYAKSDVPYKFYSGYAIEYNGNLYVFGGRYDSIETVKKCYMYHDAVTEQTWTEITNVPDCFQSRTNACVVYNNKIHLLGNDYYGQYDASKKHYSFDGTTFKEESTIPVSGYLSSFVLCNNEIHLLGGQTYSGTANANHYKYNGVSWTKLPDLPLKISWFPAITFKDRIFIFSGNTVYIYDGSTWTKNTDLTANTSTSLAISNYTKPVVYNNEIHILGGGVSPANRGHIVVSETSTTPEYLIDDDPDKFPLDGTLDGYTYKRIN